MKTIRILNKDIDMIDNVNEMLIADYIKYQSIIKDFDNTNEDEEYRYGYTCGIISIFTGIDVDELYNNAALRDVNSAYDTLMESLNTTQLNTTPQDKILIDGIEYTKIDFESMTFGQYLDLKTVESLGNLDMNLSSMFAIIYYNRNIPTKKRIDIFNKHLTIGPVVGALLEWMEFDKTRIEEQFNLYEQPTEEETNVAFDKVKKKMERMTSTERGVGQA